MDLTGILDSIKTTKAGDRGLWLIGQFLPDRRTTPADILASYSPTHRDPITIKGTITGNSAPVGGSFKLTGSFEASPYGTQFCFRHATSIRPASEEGIRRYLQATLPFVGPSLSTAIVTAFGAQTLTVIDTTPEKLLAFPGITEARLVQIKQIWSDTSEARTATVELNKLGLTEGQIGRLCTAYATAPGALRVIQENPYRLIEEVDGFGWERSDHLGSRLGFTADDHRRAQAAAYYLLTVAAEEGHTYLTAPELQERAKKLNIPASVILVGAQASRSIVTVGEWDADDDPEDKDWRYALTRLYHAEMAAAIKIKAILAHNPKARLLRIEDMAVLDSIAAHQTLDPDQVAAIHSAIQHPISLITGGPGVGKSRTASSILEALKALYNYTAEPTVAPGWTSDDPFPSYEVALAAPTGKAAQRMSELTGCVATTIHRLLAWQPEEVQTASGRNTHFAYNSRNHLPKKVLILDESSMLDAELFRDVVSALPLGIHLVIVGDIDQLPSVGAGAVLRDLIDSKAIPVARLTHVHRQEEGSGITKTAHAVNAGKVPNIDNSSGKLKFYHYPILDKSGEELPPSTIAERIAAGVIALVSHPQGPVATLALDPVKEVQVLIPGKAGACGTAALNVALQAVLNPPAPGKAELAFNAAPEDDQPEEGVTAKINGRRRTAKARTPTRILREGDRVIQTRNNYNLNVFNGDVGTILRIFPKSAEQAKDEVIVAFEEGPSDNRRQRLVTYGPAEVFSLHLAYALTIHKSQGSEFLMVILVMSTTHFMLLKKNLVYTGITRAKDHCIIIGTEKALSIAIKNNSEEKRNTFLKEELRK